MRATCLCIMILCAALLLGCTEGTPQPTPTPTPAPPTPTATPTPTPTPTATPGPECESDADCVPAQCCHPMSCVARSQAPNCSGVACTMVCMPGTMDCGGGRCICFNGTCGVSSVPTPTPAPTPIPTQTPAPFRPCRETDSRIDFTHRGTALGEYNGRMGMWEDICSWNGNETVL